MRQFFTLSGLALSLLLFHSSLIALPVALGDDLSPPPTADFPVPPPQAPPVVEAPAKSFSQPTVAEPSTPPLTEQAPPEGTPPPPVTADAPVEKPVEKAVEPEPAPEPAAPQDVESPTLTRSSGPIEEVTMAQETPRTKIFRNIRPDWAIQLSYAPSAFGGADVSGNLKATASGISLAGEFQPAWIQTVGIIGFGPTASIYPILPLRGDVQNTPYTIWSYGAELRYQAHFFTDQLIVPTVAYNFEHLRFNTIQLGQTSLNLAGPSIGAYILLNRLEPSAAYELYSDSGILRTYLTVELRYASGSNVAYGISGNSYFFGVRTEF